MTTQKPQKIEKKQGFSTHKNPIEARHKTFFMFCMVLATLVLCVSMILGVTWTKDVYYSDSFNDSSINTTLWSNGTTNGDGTVTEYSANNGYINITQTTGGISYLVTNYDYNDSSYNRINVTMSANAGVGSATYVSICQATSGYTSAGQVIDGCKHIIANHRDVMNYDNVTLTFNNTDYNYTSYINGVVNGSQIVNAYDHHYLMFFSYNAGSAKTTTLHSFDQFDETGGINIVSPSGLQTINSALDFKVTTQAGAGLKNLSLYIDGAYTAVLNITGTSNSSTFEDVGVSIGNHTWNAVQCDVNSTCTNSSTATFTRRKWIENSQTYDDVISEGALTTLNINITYNSSHYTDIDAILHYNSTTYTGTQIDSGDNIRFSRTITAPSVATSINKSFFWTVEFINATSTYANSTTNNQTIDNVNIDDCGTFSLVLLNFTLRDEETQNRINGTEFNSTVEIEVELRTPGTNTVIMNMSQNYTQNNNPQVCLQSSLGNATYELSSTISYQADTYAAEFYHIQNSTITNASITQNINLFDLKSVDAQNFLVTFKDANFLPVEDALIQIQRRYISEAVFKTVEIPKTDNSGQAAGSFDLTGALYTIVVTKNGVILATFDNIAVICQDTVIGDCRINLNTASSTLDFTDWEKRGGITNTMLFNKTTRRITVIFTSTDGTAKTVMINATKYDMFGNDTICTDSLTSASGTLICDIPASYGNVTIKAKLYSDGNLIRTEIYIISASVRDIFGTDGLVLFLILMLTIPLMLATTGVGVVIGVIMGLVLGAFLTLVDTGTIIGTASFIIWGIIAGLIIIWKISRREG